MALRKSCLLGLATTLLVALTEQSTIAFTITPPQPGANGNYNPLAPYNLSNGTGETFLDTYLLWYPDTWRDISGGVTEIARGGTRGLLNLLQPFVDRGWTFNVAPNNLKGSFEILHNYACQPTTNCGIEDFPGDFDQGSVGSHFRLNYRPGTNDPYGNNVHWIQRVISSYTEDSEQKPSDSLDIDPGQDNPYYDFDSTATTDYFIDTPYTVNPRINHYFVAELYLVEQTATRRVGSKNVGDVTIYNGIRWGWKNRFTPSGCITVDMGGISVNIGINCSPPSQPTKTFSGTLKSGSQTDQYKLDGLTPGNYFYAWTNNSIPSNRCNPNTYLYATSGTGYNYDNDSSSVGDGFASALSGIVPNNGIIDLFVSANSGVRGEDRGSYELNVKVYDSEPAPPSIIIGSSGGGGVSRPRPGNTQQNPILPTSNSGSWQIFNNVPSCRWYDPHTTYGFEFQALEDTLFTEILDFPVGLDNRFKVSVGNAYLGEFSPGDRVDFVSLFGQGVSQFKITDIDALIGNTEETAFPIQLAFNKSVGSFQMRPFHADETQTPKRVPEPMSVLGLLALSIWGGFQAIKISSDSLE
ncbi:hypothetical protein ACE1CI_31520 [Aerosakkonemataceae cyanobacterium BLCC-F50]|uniref:PEP-CTERM sorting domain-containing protein n=1 Tax=Floridaenema flaviceps BLCC-F50 TaxID=3153642 RepID=A0ABV4Y163_9CYAN